MIIFCICTDGIDIERDEVRGEVIDCNNGFLFVVDMASTSIGMLLVGNSRTMSVMANMIVVANDGIIIPEKVTRWLT